MEKFIVPCDSGEGRGLGAGDSVTKHAVDISGGAGDADGAGDAGDVGDAGDAGDDTPRAVVGGVEHVVGGWALHAANRRKDRADAGGERPGALYTGRTYVYADDAVNSLTADTWESPGVLRGALLHLGDALARLEDRLCEPDEDSVWECGRLRPDAGPSHLSIGIPALTSTDLRLAAADPAVGADPDALRDLADAALEVAAVVGEVLPPLPQIEGLTDFPDHPVRVADDEAVLRLESSVVPHLATLEQYQAALATRLDEVAAAVARAVAKLDARASK